MILVKHAVLGNKHVSELDYPVLFSQGWVKWPRTAEQKNAAQVSDLVCSSPPTDAGAAPTVDSLKAELETKGIPYDKRWGLKKLQEALNEHGSGNN